MYRRGPCIAGPIHGPMYRRADTCPIHGDLFIYVSVFFCVYLDGLFDTHRYMTLLGYIILQNTTKHIWENTYLTFGGNRTQAPPGYPPVCLGYRILRIPTDPSWEHAAILRITRPCPRTPTRVFRCRVNRGRSKRREQLRNDCSHKTSGPRSR